MRCFQNCRLLLQWLYHLFEIKMFLLRSCCLLNVCFEIDCLQRIILFVVVLLLMNFNCVFVDAVLMKLLRIYFYIVIFFLSVWHFIYLWMDISSVTSLVVSDHFNQFTSGGVGTKARQSILQVL